MLQARESQEGHSHCNGWPGFKSNANSLKHWLRKIVRKLVMILFTAKSTAFQYRSCSLLEVFGAPHPWFETITSIMQTVVHWDLRIRLQRPPASFSWTPERERSTSNKVAIANWEEVEAKMQGKAGQGVKGIVVSRILLRLCHYSAKQCAARPWNWDTAVGARKFQVRGNLRKEIVAASTIWPLISTSEYWTHF